MKNLMSTEGKGKMNERKLIAEIQLRHGKSAGMLTSIIAAFAVASFASPSPYGVCAHVSRDEFDDRIKTYDMMSLGGLGYVRSDFDWYQCQFEPGGAWNFAKFDRTVDDAAARGITVLPILYGIPRWAQPVNGHMEEFQDYIRRMTEHFGARITVVEIWNEQNLKSFWKGEPNPTNYLAVLKAAYEAVKDVDSRVRVSSGGTAGVPFEFIEEVYRLGGARYFDILAVHPYSHPDEPEGRMDVQLEKLREIMARYGDEGKPVWITEMGWPTHTPNVGGFGLLSGALKVARPEKSSWNVVFAACVADDATPLAGIGDALLAALPPGSSVAVCTPQETCRRLAAGGVDAVVYPFDETYPVDTVDAVVEFVKKGGTLVDFGGMPMWKAWGRVNGAYGLVRKRSTVGDRRRLRIQEDAWWMGDKSLPEVVMVQSTPEAVAAGVKQEPTGFKAMRFQTSALLKAGDRMIPLLEGRNPNNGKNAVAACVYAFDSDYKGRVIVSGLMTRGTVASNSEARQGVLLARALGISFAEGVESFFWYEFRAPERDPFYSEHHFGLVHDNFAPKPAWGAYKNFVLQRPAGSVQLPGTWRNGKRTAYFPQWRRPDGRVAGMLWKLDKAVLAQFEFTGEEVVFHDVWGKRIVPVKTGPRTWKVPVGESPVYFAGAALAHLPESPRDGGIR